MTKLRPGEDERALRLGQRRQDARGSLRIERLRLRRQVGGVGPERGRVLDLLLQQVERQAQVHRTRPAGAARCAPPWRDRCRAPPPARRPRRLGDRRRHLGLAQLLEGAASHLLDAGVPREQHQRRFAGQCRARAAAALVKPGPPVTSAMPHWPVSRPQASAMCTAAASWRTWISLSRVPIAASNSGMMWLPESVKIVVRPAASSVRATMSAPLILVGICACLAGVCGSVRRRSIQACQSLLQVGERPHRRFLRCSASPKWSGARPPPS